MHASHASLMVSALHPPYITNGELPDTTAAYLCSLRGGETIAAGSHCFQVVHIVLDLELALGGTPVGVGLMVGQRGRIHQVARVLQAPLHPRRRILHMLQQISVY